jgi:hypothetical protein
MILWGLGALGVFGAGVIVLPTIIVAALIVLASVLVGHSFADLFVVRKGSSLHAAHFLDRLRGGRV